MAFEILVNGQILTKSSTPVASGLSVKMSTILETNSITGYRNTSLFQTTTTDGGGRVLFSGVSNGSYDIAVSHPSGTYNLYNYVVRNYFPVPEGSTTFLEESRTYVVSKQTISGAGVLVNNEPRSEQHLGYPSETKVEPFSGLGYSTKYYENRIDGSIITDTVQLSREFDDSYFAKNQNLQVVQNFTLKLPV